MIGDPLFRRMARLADMLVMPKAAGVIYAQNGQFDSYTYCIEARAAVAGYPPTLIWTIHSYWCFAGKDGGSYFDRATKYEYSTHEALATVERNIETIRATGEPLIVLLFVPDGLHTVRDCCNEADLGM